MLLYVNVKSLTLNSVGHSQFRFVCRICRCFHGDWTCLIVQSRRKKGSTLWCKSTNRKNLQKLFTKSTEAGALLLLGKDKVRCVFPIVIWSEIRVEQGRDDDHWEDAPNFRKILILSPAISKFKRPPPYCIPENSEIFDKILESFWIRFDSSNYKKFPRYDVTICSCCHRDSFETQLGRKWESSPGWVISVVHCSDKNRISTLQNV